MSYTSSAVDRDGDDQKEKAGEVVWYNIYGGYVLPLTCDFRKEIAEKEIPLNNDSYH